MGPRPVAQHPVQAPLVEAVVNLILHPLQALHLAHSQLALVSLRQALPISPHLKLVLSLVVALVHHLLMKHLVVVIQPVKIHCLATLTR